jgi:TolB-like protein
VIAVLPFTNMSGDPTDEFFTDGITEDIITGLTRFTHLLVIARNTTLETPEPDRIPTPAK